MENRKIATDPLRDERPAQLKGCDFEPPEVNPPDTIDEPKPPSSYDVEVTGLDASATHEEAQR